MFRRIYERLVEPHTQAENLALPAKPTRRNVLGLTLTTCMGVAIVWFCYAQMSESMAQKAKLGAKDVQQKAEKILGATVSSVRAAPIKDWWELTVDDQIIYTDARVDYLFVGNMIDLKTKSNLTEEARNKSIKKLSRSDFKLDDAFLIVKGKGERELILFSDPNCGYCKRLEQALVKVDNVRIYTFLYPILGENSREKAQNVWCAKKNQQEVWHNWMLLGSAPPAHEKDCDVSAIERNVAFGQMNKINGTPTLFFANGQRVPGAIDEAEIEKFLNEK